MRLTYAGAAEAASATDKDMIRKLEPGEYRLYSAERHKDRPVPRAGRCRENGRTRWRRRPKSEKKRKFALVDVEPLLDG